MKLSPSLLCFTVEQMAVRVPSATADSRSYRVTFQGTNPGRCECAGYAFRKTCGHISLASDFLFGIDGLYASLEMIDCQLAALPEMAPTLGRYALAALVGLRDEISRRISEIEPPDEPEYDARRLSNCPCGKCDIPGDGDTICPRCKVSVRDAWSRQAAPKRPFAFYLGALQL